MMQNLPRFVAGWGVEVSHATLIYEGLYCQIACREREHRQSSIASCPSKSDMPSQCVRLQSAALQVLRSVPLRNMANQMAYYDKQTLATEDAMRIGRLHTFLPG